VSGNFRDDPVIIFCTSRGGSSLVAGVFARLGFWEGSTFGGEKGWRMDGYPTHENAEIKDFIKENWTVTAPGDHEPRNLDKADLRYFVERRVKPQGEWFFKTLSEHYPIWLHHFPRMTPVFVFRDAQQAVEGHVRRRGEKVRETATEVVTKRYRYMHAILMNRRDAFRVDAERIADFDFSQLEPILEKYDKTIDHRAAAEGISPEKLTRRA